MSKYRIIKVKGYDSLYLAQKRILFFFWKSIGCYEGSITDAQEWVNVYLAKEKSNSDNPKNIVVKIIKA